MAFSYNSCFQVALAALKREGRYRVFADIMQRAAPESRIPFLCRQAADHGVVQQRLSQYGPDLKVLAAMHEALDSVGAGSGGTRNISGTSHYHVELSANRPFHGKEAALLFTPALSPTTPRCRPWPRCCRLMIFSDEFNHASMIEGIRHGGTAKRYIPP